MLIPHKLKNSLYYSRTLKPKTMEIVKMTTPQFVEFMSTDALGATFSGLEYFCNESRSRQDKKNYPLFDGKNHKLQKLVKLNATLNSCYQGKRKRILSENGIDFDFESNKITGRHYIDYDKNRVFVYPDNKPETPENAQLAFIGERHSKPQTQLFHKGEPVDRKDVWNDEFITPSGLRSDGKKAVQNATYNHALRAIAKAEEEGDIAKAQDLRRIANILANNEELKQFEYQFRTVKVTNIRSVNVKGMRIIIEN